MSLSNSYRIQYYTGMFSASSFYVRKDFSSFILPISKWDTWNSNPYSRDLKEVIQQTHLDQLYRHKRIKYYPRDRVELFTDVPTLVKSRLITKDPHYSILCKLNIQRHFQMLTSVSSLDIPFHQKTNRLVWRGTSTGYGFGNDIPYRSVSRETLVKTYAHSLNPQLDIGLSGLVQGGKKTHKYQPYLKSHLSIRDMLTYKYILSVEGNDVASNLKWALYSNSVVLMPLPMIESWILESHLIPNYHYILIQSDFSDLEQKIQWCDAHPDLCEQIIHHATEYIHLFMHQENEQYLMKKVLQYYLDHVDFLD